MTADKNEIIYTTDRQSDVIGQHGEAWIILKEFDDRPDAQGTLQSWIVRAAWAHPIWSHYQITVIHLRDIEGVKPANKVFDEATHEIMVVALEPDKPYPLNAPPNLLMPINYAGQWVAENDAEALQKGEECIEKILEGQLSPDTDFRRQWDKMFRSK